MLKFVCRPSGPRSAPQLLGAIIAGTALLVSSSVASAATIAWAIDSSQSSITLNVPDQSVSLGGTTATIRLRDAGNNNNWTQGRTAAVAGTLVTDYVDGVSIEFLGGQHNAFGLVSGNFRPNPAAFDPNSTNSSNPNGQYTNTTTAPAVYAARVRASVSILTVDAGFVSFLDVDYDIMSAPLALDGSGNFAGNALTMGVADALIAFDGLSVALIGQPIPDQPPTPLGAPVLGSNTAAGASVTAPDPVGDPLLRKLTIPVNVPLQLDLQGALVNASATGQIVAYAYLTAPEPGTVVLLAFGLGGLAIVGRKRA